MSDLRRIKPIFSEAIDKKGSDRESYLNEICGKDLELKAKVKALLGAHEKAGDFLESPILDTDVILDESIVSEDSGTIIGRYKLLEKIGEGGMAVIYMAEQEEPIRRKAALKIIKLGMDTRQVIARFEAERQALAMMDHPNIAKVFDAGSTETGRPYFVMELVTGVCITEYCDKNRISINKRLKLFMSVCNAIHHAHQKGIIHRDIKPSNIMVTLHNGEPVPKVIDFGIAKAINQRLTEKTLFTRYAHMIGTPAYMSPEQAEMSDVDVDTRTDIYSLGVLLYELLTGATPFDKEELHKANLSEIQKIICEQEPNKPSTKLNAFKDSMAEIAECRQTNPEALSGLVRGDLDWIVMKCLEKDRTRRYETVHALVEDIERHLRNEPVLARSPSFAYRAQKFWMRHRSYIVTTTVVTVLLAGIVVIAVLYRQSVNAQKVQWAQSVALPEIIKLIDRQDYNAAFSLAKRAQQYIPENSVLTDLWPRICKNYSINTTPAGASIFYREYSAIDESWRYLGRSPLENIPLPQGVYRWKIEKNGFKTHECVTDRSYDVRLLEEGHLGEMVWIKAWQCEISSSSFDKTTTIKSPAHLIDKYEVTNEQFKEFVDSGGYTNQEYWRESEFLKEGKMIPWEQAISNFVDKTGQHGPATWEKGNYPEGQGRHPVSGISWFEADAYARFIGKSLPTVHHWEHAASFRESIVIVPYSNFTTGETAPVGSHMGVGETGLYDMAGNVKEWCWNATDDENSHRYILGGGWGEQTYLFTMRDSRSPWNRSVINGFRCVQYPEQEGSVSDALFSPLGQRSIRDYSTEMPCSDEEYQIIARQFDYDRTPLNASVESIDDNSPFWRKEKITFDAGYDGERVIAFLFVPRSVEPPYQVVVYWPAGGTSRVPEFTDLPQREWTEHIITSGRALLFPVYKGMFQRRLATWPDPRHAPLKFRDLIIQVSKDIQRSVDYLETRDDINKERIAYYGVSGGATFGPLALAVEDRFKTAVFVVGGFYTWMKLPAATDPLNHAPRVKAPVLMINGKEDFYFPVETSQVPMFKLLGTLDKDKDHKVYPGGHGLLGLFSKQIRGDVLGWLDRYLGPVNEMKKDIK